jgi:dihydrofolate reductase
MDEIRKLKLQSGKEIHVVGGDTLVSNLMNAGLIDELRLMISSLILGGEKALFKDVKERHTLKLVRAKHLKLVKVGLTYSVQSSGDLMRTPEA